MSRPSSGYQHAEQEEVESPLSALALPPMYAELDVLVKGEQPMHAVYQVKGEQPMHAVYLVTGTRYACLISLLAGKLGRR